ncbi:hypothetical protein IFR05_017209 [Cadophora sp. M221]|nr:hypothetical protein IFR05_017209 [Cadophora sp. M221]
MISQAISSTPHSGEGSSQGQYGNIEFRQAAAEDLWFVQDAELDMAVAGQAAHWFDYTRVWPELARTVRKGGTLAFWGYKDNVFVDFPRATRVLDRFCYGDDRMGPFWEQPGRNILRGKLRGVVPPDEEWEDVRRIEYEPSVEGGGRGKGVGEVLMQRRLKLGEVEGYVRTFSAYWNWVAEHPEEKSRAEGGEGDVVDEMFDEMREVEPEWKKKGEDWRDIEVDNEWGSAILLARRK